MARGASRCTAKLLLALFTAAACSPEDPVAPSIPAPASPSAPGQQRGPTVVPGQYLILFQDDVTDARQLAGALGAANGFGPRHIYDAAIKGFSAALPDAAVQALLNNPRVLAIEPNYIAYLDAVAAAPTVPLNGLRVRLTAGGLSGLTDGADVATWPNSLGSDADAVAPAADRQPTFHAGSAGGPFAGQPFVGFNEGGDNDEHLEIGGVAYHGSATVVVVFRQEDASNHNYGLLAFYESGRDRTAFMTYRKGSGNRLAYWDRTNGWKNSSFTLNAGTDHVAVWRVDGSNAVDFQIDGVAYGSLALSSDIHTPFSKYVIGNSDPGSGSRFDGWIAELLVYDRVLPDCERDGIASDLGAYYGVSVAAGSVCALPDGDPSGLVASAAGSTEIQLTWTDGTSNEAGFTIERAAVAGGPFAEVAQVGTDIVVYSDTGLEDDTQYCYRVRAFTGVGVSQYTNVDCATTPLFVPPPPAPPVPTTGLRLRLNGIELLSSLGDGDGVDVWPNPEGSEGDAVAPSASRQPTYYTGTPGGPFGGMPHVGLNEGGDNDEHVEVSGVTYHGSATVIAVLRQEDASGHNYGFLGFYSDGSNRAGFMTRHDGGASPISYWDATNGWNDAEFTVDAGVDHVVVWRVDGSRAVDFQVDGVARGSHAIGSDIHSPFVSYVVGNSQPGSGSRFDGWLAEVLIYDRALSDCERDGIVGDLGSYYGVSVAAGSICEPPDGDPSSLVASAVGPTEISISWTDGTSNEAGFTIERAAAAGGPFAEVAQVGTDVVTYSDMGLTNDTEYCYRVSAFTGVGVSGYTNVDCATTPEIAPPPPVPPVPANGLRLRLNGAELLPLLGDGDGIDVWPNPEGSEGDALAPSASRQPTFYAGSPGGPFGGMPYVGLNEGGDNDEYVEVAGVTYHGSATVIAVLRQEDASSHNYGFFALYSDGTNRAGFMTRHNGGAGPISYWDRTNGWNDAEFTVDPGTDHIVVWRVDGSVAVDFQVDGVARGSDVLGSDIHSPFVRYVLGNSNPGSGSRFDGWVADLLVYDRALLDCERDGIVGDFGAHYGISVPAGAVCAPPDGDPTELAAFAVGPTEIGLTWTDGTSNEAGFTIERAAAAGGPFSEVAQVAADVVVYNDTGLTDDTQYCYRVAAFTGIGFSSYTNIDCATTPEILPPPPPPPVPTQGLRLRLNGAELLPLLGDGDGVDTWPNPEGSEGDALAPSASQQPTFYAGSVGGPFAGMPHVGLNEGGDNDEYVEVAGVTYHGSATVIAVLRQQDASGHNYGFLGFYSNSTDRTGFMTRHNGGGSPLSYWDRTNGWNDSDFSVAAGVDHVVVWRVDGSNEVDFQIDGAAQGEYSLSADIHAPFASYVLGNSEPGSGSRFDGFVAEVLVYDRALPDCERDNIVSALGGVYGVSVSVTPRLCVPPDAPSDLSASALDYETIRLTWTDGSVNEDNFEVEHQAGAGAPFIKVATVPANTTEFDDGGLIPELDYCYRVRAVNGDGVSGFTTVQCATPDPPPPGACPDTGNHDDLADLWNISRIEANGNRHWRATQRADCELEAWYFGLDSGVDSDHPDLNVVEVLNFVASEPGRSGEDANGHGTHTAGIAAAIDGNGGVVGVAPGAPVYGFRVCSDDGSCTYEDIIAGVDEVTARKLANPDQPMVVNMSLAGPASEIMDIAVRHSVNAGVVHAIGAGNGVLGICFFPDDAQTVSPARVGDDDINAADQSSGNTRRVNGVLTVTSSNASDSDDDCNYGNPVTVAAPGTGIKSTWLNGGYYTASGTSMATPHAAGAAILYLQSDPTALPMLVEQFILGQLDPWSTDNLPNADGRLNVRNN